jgi:hypothetical protein
MADYIRRDLLGDVGEIVVGTAVDTLGVLNWPTLHEEVLVAASGESEGIKTTDPRMVAGIIDRLFGPANTVFEFNSDEAPGDLTAIGSPAAESVYDDVVDCYYVADNNSSMDLAGRYTTMPSAPFTIMCHLVDDNALGSGSAGVFVAESNTTDVRACGRLGAEGQISSLTTTAPTTNFTALQSRAIVFDAGGFFAIRVNSNSDYDFMASADGGLWVPLTEAHNPSATLSSPAIGGLYVVSRSTTLVAAAFNWLRIWNSAKSFPGVAD